jgi:hypothetical protein
MSAPIPLRRNFVLLQLRGLAKKAKTASRMRADIHNGQEQERSFKGRIHRRKIYHLRS